MLKTTSRVISLVLSFLLISEQSGYTQTIGQLDISSHLRAFQNTITSNKYRPLHLRYLGYDSQNNSFKLLLDKGDYLEIQNGKEKTKEEKIEEETNKLMEYFFIGLALPNESFWVNLRPGSRDDIIDEQLAQTDIGRVMLEADVQLKKDVALYTSPQRKEGKEYWDKLYKKAEELYGCDNVIIPTLTRPWIVPGEIIIRETQDNVYIYKATLKVMLEEDYLKREDDVSLRANEGTEAISKQRLLRRFTHRNYTSDPRQRELNIYSTQLIKELIIPKITREVNTSKKYAMLRQVYYSLILAQWFKSRVSLRAQSFIRLINSGNLAGVTSKQAWDKGTYYRQYQKSFEDGEYNLKDLVRASFGRTIRSYFSGGINLAVNSCWSNVNRGIVTLISGKEKIGFLNIIKRKYVFVEYNGNNSTVDFSSFSLYRKQEVSSPITKETEKFWFPKLLLPFLLSALLFVQGIIYPNHTTAYENTLKQIVRANQPNSSIEEALSGLRIEREPLAPIVKFLYFFSAKAEKNFRMSGEMYRKYFSPQTGDYDQIGLLLKKSFRDRKRLEEIFSLDYEGIASFNEEEIENLLAKEGILGEYYEERIELKKLIISCLNKLPMELIDYIERIDSGQNSTIHLRLKQPVYKVDINWIKKKFGFPLKMSGVMKCSQDIYVDFKIFSVGVGFKNIRGISVENMPSFVRTLADINFRVGNIPVSLEELIKLERWYFVITPEKRFDDSGKSSIFALKVDMGLPAEKSIYPMDSVVVEDFYLEGFYCPYAEFQISYPAAPEGDDIISWIYGLEKVGKQSRFSTMILWRDRIISGLGDLVSESGDNLELRKEFKKRIGVDLNTLNISENRRQIADNLLTKIFDVDFEDFVGIQRKVSLEIKSDTDRNEISKLKYILHLLINLFSIKNNIDDECLLRGLLKELETVNSNRFSKLDTKSTIGFPIRNQESRQASPNVRQNTEIENKQVVSGRGGIDFAAMSIVTQPMINPQDDLRAVSSGISFGRGNGDSAEWQQIERMVNAGIMPSTQRIKEYLVSSCITGDFKQEMDKVICCIADILRLDEEDFNPADPGMCEILNLLESDKPVDEVQIALSRIDITSKCRIKAAQK